MARCTHGRKLWRMKQERWRYVLVYERAEHCTIIMIRCRDYDEET